jgi:cytochrome c
MPLIAALLALVLFGSAAHAQDPIRVGRALLQEHCASCHAIGRTDTSRHADAPPLRRLGRSFDLDEFPRRLERGISSSHPDMPEFRFSHDDARAARDYLRTIQQ